MLITQGIFEKQAKSNAMQMRHYPKSNETSVAQKSRILAIKAICDPKNPYLTDAIDDSMKIKAEITSFNMKY